MYDLFEFDEAKALNFRKFFSFYRDQFPMLIVIIGGHYGETKFDCYDNLQVLRINCATSQPRVVVDDSRRNPASRRGFVTIPEDTPLDFRVVKGHTRVGNPQKLKEILKERTELPLLLQFACDPQYPVRVGYSRQVARDFGNIFIRERYAEHFFLMNCVDGLELKMNKLTCMACLSEDLEATPVTGFKYKSKEEFDKFFESLSKQVEESGVPYDKKSGNLDFSEYSFEDMQHLLEISEYRTGALPDPTDSEEEESDDSYEEIPPPMPPRDIPKSVKPPIKERNKTPKAQQQANATPTTTRVKEPKVSADKEEKESKHIFPFHFKKKHKDGNEGPQIPKKPTKLDKKLPQSPEVTRKASLTETPQLPPHAPPHATLLKPQNESKQRHASDSEQRGGQYVSLSGHSGYQNTKIGRATVRPLPRSPVSPHEAADISKPSEEDYLDIYDDDYSVLSETLLIKEKVSVGVTKRADKAHIRLQGNSNGKETKDAARVESGLYEVMDVQETNRLSNDYLIPTSDTSASNQYAGANKGHSTTETENVDSKPVSNTTEENNQSLSNDEHTENEAVQTTKSLSIQEVGEKLSELKLDKYVETFKDNQVDGEILLSLTVEDLVNELGLKKLEAIRLHKFASKGHIPR